jgi:transcriptional regulator with XRE-family HTH domain
MSRTAPNRRALRWIVAVDGERVGELRRQRGLARAELALLAGLSLGTVARLESEHGTTCRTRTLARIVAALGEQPGTIAAVTLRDRVTTGDTTK